MKAVLLLAAVILYGGCSATPIEVYNGKPSQNGESQASTVTSNSARGTATPKSLNKASSKSSAQASVGGSAQIGNQGSGGFGVSETKGSAGSKSNGIGNQRSGNTGGRGSVGFKNQASGGFGVSGSISFGDDDSEGDYLGKNYPYGGYDSDGEYEEQNDGFSNQQESGSLNDVDVNSQNSVSARGDFGGLSAALLLAHHANLAHLLHLGHHLYIPEIIGWNILTKGVPGGGLMNLWPLHHLTNHKLKELMYFSALAKSLPSLVKSSLAGHAKALGQQSAGLEISGRGWTGQDAKGFQAKPLIL